MTDREKLVELVHDARMNALWHNAQNPSEYITDMLIANGVTVQEDCKACAEATQNCIVKLQEQIAELRSVQELDGCDYCREDADGYRVAFGAFSLHNPFHNGEWEISTGHCKPRRIYFCPMCGRRLPQPPKGE